MNYSFYNYRFVPVNPFTYFVPTPPLLSVNSLFSVSISLHLAGGRGCLSVF